MKGKRSREQDVKGKRSREQDVKGKRSREQDVKGKRSREQDVKGKRSREQDVKGKRSREQDVKGKRSREQDVNKEKKTEKSVMHTAYVFTCITLPSPLTPSHSVSLPPITPHSSHFTTTFLLALKSCILSVLFCLVGQPHPAPVSGVHWWQASTCPLCYWLSWYRQLGHHFVAT